MYFDAEDDLPESPAGNGAEPHLTESLSGSWQATWRHSKSHSRMTTAERVSPHRTVERADSEAGTSEGLPRVSIQQAGEPISSCACDSKSAG